MIVAQTVPEMRVCADYSGVSYLNNVRVNGILAARDIDLSFLLGVLNGPVADFVFRRIGKPKQGGYYEANRQFIAPLPIPNASIEARTELAAKAQQLQERWTHRRDLMREASSRLSVLARARHPASWLWPDLPGLPETIEQAPSGLPLLTDRRRWAEAQLEEMETARLEALQASLNRDGQRGARFERGELRLYVGGSAVLSKIYLDEGIGRLAEAYWRWLLFSSPVRDAERLAADLRRPPMEPQAPAAVQFMERVANLGG